MKNKKIRIIITFIIIVILAVAAYFFFRGNNETTVQVETLTVKKGDVTTMVTATGTIEPLTEVEVGTQVSGEVEKIYVDYNSEVSKGQLLAELDKTNLKAAVQKAEANYENARNEFKYYEKIFNRQEKLLDEEVISQSDFDDAEYSYSNSRSAVTQSLSALQEARTNLGYADIYSPIDGVVLSKTVNEGQTVAANFETPTLFTIAQDLKQMQVEADVDEADIGNVKEGQRVSFTVDAYQGETFDGTVTQVRLDPSEEESVVTYTVVIKAENPELKLKPGFTATVAIYTLELSNVLTIEAKAVNFEPDMELLRRYHEQNGAEPSQPLQKVPAPANDQKTVVWQYNANAAITPQIVKLGASDGVNIQVLEGLKEGNRLVYNLKTEGKVSTRQESSSPFMPQPPGRNDKKKQPNDE
ncbi:efflux RND transporter periplasmic adaptor subunit [Salinimicrobium sp. TIG7-5_MAKvit]|uniref:efflux RND transporter periplasmic adaptor subunit n=1 Tax=Salinimicrobium sp. TIG7-5_MAKvit TaxID=3121289 RepID=UPI003C6E627A